MKESIIVGISTIASLVAAIAAIISIFVTKKCNDSQIDANIVWNARVEWIQNVRSVAVEFIANCYKYMREYDNNVKDNNLSLIEEKKLLLTMYFGPDGSKENKEEIDILSEESNSGKNSKIVKLINDIYKEIHIYHFVCERVKECNKQQAECLMCEWDKENKRYFCFRNEDGDKFLESDCTALKSELMKTKNENINTKSKIESDLKLFIDVMRIYLKIEWNRAKNRDKQ